MISSGPGRHHREHHQDNQEGRATSPTAFPSLLASLPGCSTSPSLPTAVWRRGVCVWGGGEAGALTLQLAQDSFSLQPSAMPPHLSVDYLLLERKGPC